MFLLLAPSALTGKRPGLYCLQGQRSQDAPKGPKREVRGWIVRRQHKRTHTHAHTLLKTKKKCQNRLSFAPLPSLVNSESLSRVSGNEIRTMLQLTISY